MSDFASLHQAMTCGDRSFLESEISDPSKANARDGAGRTLVHEAIAMGKPDIVEMLLERGAALTSRHALGGTPLHSLAWAARRPGYPLERMLDVLSRFVPMATLSRIVTDLVPALSLSADPRLNIEAAYAAINDWMARGTLK